MKLCTVNPNETVTLRDIKDQVLHFDDMETVLIRLRHRVWTGGIGTIMHGVAAQITPEEFPP